MINADTVNWARFNTAFELSVEPIHAALRGVQPRTIADVGVRIDLPEATIQEERPDVALATGLHPPEPSPFNPSVTLSFTLATPAVVDLNVYDTRGLLVKTMVSGRQDAGQHSVVWNGIDDQGQKVARGAYFARFDGGGMVQTHRMVLLK